MVQRLCDKCNVILEPNHHRREYLPTIRLYLKGGSGFQYQDSSMGSWADLCDKCYMAEAFTYAKDIVTCLEAIAKEVPA